MKTLRGLKPGDTVYVVHQAKQRETDRRVEAVPVVKIGRKYGYVAHRIGDQGKFSLDTGESCHDPNHNARVNGYGFDVYLREEDWQLDLYELRRFRELALLLCGPCDHRSLKPLPPHVVEAIHAILEDENDTND